MTFYHTAENIRIDDGHMLRARLQRADGEWNDAEIDLNACIGNDNGMFVSKTRCQACVFTNTLQANSSGMARASLIQPKTFTSLLKVTVTFLSSVLP